jgi:L-ascorbate metabolism protein UlaG (beta-lactamase superfamily)
MASDTTVTDATATITWLGHATTKIEYNDSVILIDPFLTDNPATPENMKDVERCDLMLISHAHGDHFADAIPIARKTGCTVICIVELAAYLRSKGIQNVIEMNKGGTVDWNGIEVTMVDAIHSSSITDGDQVIYAGTPAGFVIRFPNLFTLYHSGDTDLFEGFRVIGSRYRPDVAMLPIGGHYTMDPGEAAEALRMLGVKTVIPIHYGTFPVLTGTPDDLIDAASDIDGLDVVALKPGESVTNTDLV